MKKSICVILTLLLALSVRPEAALATETASESTETEAAETEIVETAAADTEAAETEAAETEAAETEAELLMAGNSISVTEDFGAAGDGVTDDTLAFQRALRSVAGAKSMVTIKVPAGTYIISNYLPIYSYTCLSLDENAVIRAENFNSGTLLGAFHVHTDGSSCDGDGVNDPGCNIGGYDQIQHVIIEGGCWDRNITGSDPGAIFRLVHGNDITIRNTTLMHASDHFINISGSKNVTVKNVTFRDFVYDYIDRTYVNRNRAYQNECVHTDALQPISEAYSYPRDGTAARDVNVTDCSFINVSDGVGTHYFNTESTTISRSQNIKVTGCTFTNLSGRAVDAYSTDQITVKNCTATDCASFVVAREATGTISGNTINSTKVHTAHNSWDEGQGIIILDCSRGFTVSDNAVYNTASHGIWVARVKISEADPHTSYAKISGNTVYGTRTEGGLTTTGEKEKLFDILVGANCKADITNNNVGLRGVHSYSKLKVTLSNNTTRDAAGKWQRLYGAGRYDTMKTIVQAGFKTTGGTAIIATGTGFKDALAAAGLAGLEKAPVILTDGKSLSAQARSELERLKPRKIYVAGGPVAVSDNVMNAIKKDTKIGAKTVTRLYGGPGTGSASTSASLALTGAGKWQGVAVIATNKSFKDALSAAPVAYAMGWPILLSDNGKSLNKDVLKALEDCEISEVVIVGGSLAVTKNVETQLKKAGISLRARWDGKNAVETSARIAREGIALGLTPDHMGIATSQNFPDALAGAALCGINRSVLLLADDKAMTNASFPADYKETLTRGYVFGGSFAVGVKAFTHLVCAGQ